LCNYIFDFSISYYKIYVGLVGGGIMVNFFKKFFVRETTKDTFCSAIIVAAGKGTRMKSDNGKMFLEICEMPVIFYTIREFDECKDINEIIIVTREEDIVPCMDLVNEFEFNKVKKIISGGKERSDSVLKGLKEAANKANIIAIHDGARPLINKQDISKVISEAKEDKAAALGVRVKDTIKVLDENQYIVDTPERKNLWSVQTPQVFSREIIQEAYQIYRKEKELGGTITDDCMLVERMGHRVKMVEGSYENIKITTSEDIVIAEAILRYREGE
jgi:2-C-methyl-D-erythritol 4-phosphate cytidylyltransferase